MRPWFRQICEWPRVRWLKRTTFSPSYTGFAAKPLGVGFTRAFILCVSFNQSVTKGKAQFCTQFTEVSLEAVTALAGELALLTIPHTGSSVVAAAPLIVVCGTAQLYKHTCPCACYWFHSRNRLRIGSRSSYPKMATLVSFIPWFLDWRGGGRNASIYQPHFLFLVSKHVFLQKNIGTVKGWALALRSSTKWEWRMVGIYQMQLICSCYVSKSFSCNKDKTVFSLLPLNPNRSTAEKKWNRRHIKWNWKLTCKDRFVHSTVQQSQCASFGIASHYRTSRDVLVSFFCSIFEMPSWYRHHLTYEDTKSVKNSVCLAGYLLNREIEKAGMNCCIRFQLSKPSQWERHVYSFLCTFFLLVRNLFT